MVSLVCVTQTFIDFIRDDPTSMQTLYQATMYAVERLHRNGIITDAEYEICRIMMLEKYDPPIGKIVSN